MAKRLTQDEADLRVTQLKTLNKAVMVSYVLGQAFLDNMDVMLHEMKHSPSPTLRSLGKIKQQHKVILHRKYKEMFNGAGTHLDPEELKDLENKIEQIISTIW